MYGLILTLHIFAGLVGIGAALHRIVPLFERLKSVYTPSLVGVIFTGMGLVGTGASLTRACVSGTALLVAIVAIDRYSDQKLAKERIKKD